MLPSGYHADLRRLQLRLARAFAAAVLAAAPAVLVVIACAPVWIPLWLAAEAAFFVLFLVKLQRLSSLPSAPDTDGYQHSVDAFNRWIASHYYITRTVTLEQYLATWFPGVPFENITKGNVLELIAQGFFYKSRAQLEAEGQGPLLLSMLHDLETAWQQNYAEGDNPQLSYFMHLTEPLKVVYKPLAWYAIAEAIAGLKHWLLWAVGFQHHEQLGYTCYTYNMGSRSVLGADGTSSSSNKEPLVFLHGVGVGILPYMHFLLRLAATGQPLLAVEYKHLSMRWTDHAPNPQQVAASMLQILELHGIQQGATLVAHSFGTLFTSCLLKMAPERGFKVCMLDPVCCCMWSGHLVARFVYKPHGSLLGMITWFISRDVHTAAAVQRGFFWTHLNLWPHEVPEQAVIVLSGQDDLVPVHHVDAMLRHETKARVLTQPHYKHAGFLTDVAFQDTIVEATLQMLQEAPRHKRNRSQASWASGLSVRNSSSSSLSDETASPPFMSRSNSMGSNASGTGLALADKSP